MQTVPDDSNSILAVQEMQCNSDFADTSDIAYSHSIAVAAPQAGPGEFSFLEPLWT